jgi:hypothetical protein
VVHRRKPKLLFVCKKKLDSYGVSYGLLNSAAFAANAMREQGIDARVISVSDNNYIDREVSKSSPTHVMIEAIWVTPSKFHVLKALHPSVSWVVRVHSKTPFLANEGNAVEWIREYARDGVVVAPNSPELAENLSRAAGIKAAYLPNIYCPPAYPDLPPRHPRGDDPIDVGCFGAIRPMKNHLIQAFVAIRFANWLNTRLRFHVNANRVEQHGDQPFRNLRALFAHGKLGELVEHPWSPHADFVKLVRSMDIGMQVSLSESFNIVTADFVANNVPIVVSNDVEWMPEELRAEPTSPRAMLKVMKKTWRGRRHGVKKLALAYLNKHNRRAIKLWLEFLG